MPLVYVFAASNMEAQPVLVLAARNSASGQGSTGIVVERGDERFTVIVTGMGMGNAEAKADAVLEPTHSREDGASLPGRPDAILIIGLCGGLTQSLPVQRIVAYKECLSAGPNKAPPMECWPLTANVLKHLQQQGIQVDSVVGITSPRIATTKADRLTLAQSGAGVVDMESYPILAAAARAGVPAVVLRVVSDSLDTKMMPDFNPALDAMGALDSRKALWIGLRSPVETYRLLASNKRAIEQLKPAVKFIVESDCFSSARNTMKN